MFMFEIGAQLLVVSSQSIYKLNKKKMKTAKNDDWIDVIREFEHDRYLYYLKDICSPTSSICNVQMYTSTESLSKTENQLSIELIMFWLI